MGKHRNDKRSQRFKPYQRYGSRNTTPDTRRSPSQERSLLSGNIGRHFVARATDSASGTSARLSVDAARHTGALERQSLFCDLNVVHATGSSNNLELSTSAETKNFFPNASNFKVDHSIMGERIELHQHYHYNNILKEMKAMHVTIEAEFDSSDRQYPPKCQPGTRTRFLEELKSRIRLGTRIIWLFGAAGVGKSAIMQTLAETLAPSVPCLSFFFSRPNHRNDPNKVFPTLAYRFATFDSTYRCYLEDKLTMDPYFLAKSFEEQFKRLFTDPICNNRQIGDTPRCVVLLDGLDEAEGSSAQRGFLDLIRDFVEQNKNSGIPISWIIASRPEPHLQVSFSRIEAKVPGDFWKLEVPIDSDEAIREVERYIRAEFMRIREESSDIVPDHWPSEADLLKVAASSAGLFVFASTSMAHIGDRNPVRHLRDIVGLIDHYKEDHNMRPYLTKNPFELLDILYRTIMDSIPIDSLPTAKTILGFYLLGEFVTGDPPLFVACKILGYDTSEACSALRGLHSVLRFPPQNDTETPLEFLHASFSDFLKDKSRSGRYWIDMDEEIRRVWRCYVRTFRYLLKTLHPELTSLTRDELAARMVGDALLYHHSTYNWLWILSTHCHALPCECGLSTHLVLDTAELLDAFEEFSSVLFCRELNGRPNILALEDWLFNIPDRAHAPPELLEKLYRKTMTLDELTESDFDSIFTGLCVGRPAYYNLYPLLSKVETEDLSDTEWEEIKYTPTFEQREDRLLFPRDDWRVLGDLLHLRKKIQSRLTVRIFGIGKYGLWAVIHSDSKSSVRIDPIVFPYVERVDDL